MRCIACGGSMGFPIKKRPVTTYSGTNDQYRDKIEGFPEHEEEDLCHRCMPSIRRSNSDLNDLSVSYSKDKFTALGETALSPFDTEGLDTEAMMVDNDYQGWGEEISDKMYTDAFEIDFED